MDEMIFENVLRHISVFASIIGILLGLDLLFGARFAILLKNRLDRAFYVDKAIARFFSSIKSTLDKPAVNIDDKIMSASARRAVGILFLIFSGLIIMLLRLV